jgi:hypothetical protein
MPEGLFDNPEFRIQDVVLEPQTKKPEVFFKPEEVITASDWESILKRIEKTRQSEQRENMDSYGMSDILAAMCVLFPDRREELQISHKDKAIITKFIEDEFLDGAGIPQYRLEATIQRLANYRIIFPDSPWGQDRSLDSFWSMAHAFLKLHVANDTWPEYAEHATYMSIAQPAKRDEIPALTDEEWQRFADDERIKFAVSDGFGNIGMFLKLREPDRAKQFMELIAGPTARTGRWNHLHGELDRLRQINNWEVFTQLAMKMKIMTAETATITERGIELVMPQQQLDQETSPMPEKRSF